MLARARAKSHSSSDSVPARFEQPFHRAVEPAISITAKTSAGATRVANWDDLIQNPAGYFEAIDKIHVFDITGADVGGTVTLETRGA